MKKLGMMVFPIAILILLFTPMKSHAQFGLPTWSNSSEKIFEACSQKGDTMLYFGDSTGNCTTLNINTGAKLIVGQYGKWRPFFTEQGDFVGTVGNQTQVTFKNLVVKPIGGGIGQCHAGIVRDTISNKVFTITKGSNGVFINAFDSNAVHTNLWTASFPGDCWKPVIAGNFLYILYETATGSGDLFVRKYDFTGTLLGTASLTSCFPINQSLMSATALTTGQIAVGVKPTTQTFNIIVVNANLTLAIIPTVGLQPFWVKEMRQIGSFVYGAGYGYPNGQQAKLFKWDLAGNYVSSITNNNPLGEQVSSLVNNGVYCMQFNGPYVVNAIFYPMPVF